MKPMQAFSWTKLNWSFLLAGTVILGSSGFFGIQTMERGVQWMNRTHETVQSIQKAQLAFDLGEEDYAKYLLKRSPNRFKNIGKELEDSFQGSLDFNQLNDGGLVPAESLYRLQGQLGDEKAILQDGIEKTQRGHWKEAAAEFQSPVHKALETAIRDSFVELARLESWKIKIRREEDAAAGHRNREIIAICSTAMALICLLAGFMVFVHSWRRWAAERETDRKEKRFQAVMETALDGIVLCDGEGVIRYFNQGAEKIFGYRSPAILGKPFISLLPERRYRLYRESLGEAMERNTPRLEMTGRRADGGEFQMEVTSTTARIGKEVFHTKILRDISEQRKAEGLLQEREEMFRNLFEEGPVGMILVDRDFKLVNVNYAFCHMLDFRKKDLIGGNFQSRVDPEDAQPEQSLIEKLFEGLIPHYHMEKRYVTRSGERIWSKVSASVNLGQDGKPRYMLAIVENIDEVKRVDEMKADLISVVSHQLKTPVGEINGYIENMLEGLAGDLKQRQREYLEDMREIGMNNFRLISDLLNVSKIERGVISMDIKPVPAAEVIQSAIRDYIAPIRQKGLSLQLNGLDSDLWVNADRDKTVEVLRNLINNALKCTDKGFLQLSIQEEEEDILIEVEDSGIGMGPEMQRRLFMKQSTLGPESGRAGAGLGLFIAKSFMEMQKGEIAVRSEKGKGTCFTLCLPKVRER